MGVTRKIFTRAAANLLLAFREYSHFFFSFFWFFRILALFFFLFFFLFFLLVCFLKLKYIFWYTFDYASGWAIKNFHSAGFPKQDYFFRPNFNECTCIKIFTNNWLKTKWIINQKILDMKVCCCLRSTAKFQTSFLEVALVHFNEKYRSWS